MHFNRRAFLHNWYESVSENKAFGFDGICLRLSGYDSVESGCMAWSSVVLACVIIPYISIRLCGVQLVLWTRKLESFICIDLFVPIVWVITDNNQAPVSHSQWHIIAWCHVAESLSPLGHFLPLKVSVSPLRTRVGRHRMRWTASVLSLAFRVQSQSIGHVKTDIA